MSDKTKDKGAAETAAGNMSGLARATAAASPTLEEVAGALDTIASADKKRKPRDTSKDAPAAVRPTAGNIIESVGIEACRRHGAARVWVASDGQCFLQECDANAHAANLSDRTVLKVEA